MILENGGTESRRYVEIAIAELEKHFPISQELMDMGERVASNIMKVISYSSKSAFNRDAEFTKLLNIRVGLIVDFYNNQNKEYNKLYRSLIAMAINAYNEYDANNEREEFISHFITNEIRKYRKRFNITHSSRLIDAELLSFVAVLSRVSIRVCGRDSNVFKLRYSCYRKDKKKRDNREIVIDLYSLVEASFKKDKFTSLDLISRVVLSSSENLLAYEDVNSMWKLVYTRFIEYLHTANIQKKELVIDYVQKYVLLNMGTIEIAAEHGMSKKEYDYLQQQVKYHADKFMLNDGRDIIESWLGISLENNLGLVESKWKRFLSHLSDTDKKILKYVKQNVDFEEVSKIVGVSQTKVRTRFNRMVLTAKKIRNDAKNMKQFA